MLHDVLVDGLDEWIVGYCLDEDRPVVVARCGGDIDLQCQAPVFLEHLVVDVLNGFEPGHLRVMNMVGFVVEDGQFLDLADDLTKIGLTVGCLAGGFGTEG